MLARITTAWTQWVTDRPVPLLSLFAIGTLLAGWFAIDAFQMNSDTSRLIRQDTEWKRVHDEYINAFPQHDRTTFIVVSGTAPDAVTQVTRELTTAVAAEPGVFSRVFSPAAEPFVDQHALLFLEPGVLDDTISRLADAQPFLTAIAEDHTIRQSLVLVTDAVQSDEELPAGFVQMADALNLAARGALSGDPKPIAWRDELFRVDQDDTTIHYQLIFVQGAQNFGEDLPNRLIIATLQDIIAGFDHPFKDDVRIRLTGQVPLDHGEIESAMNSAQFAGSLALVILVLVLVWGVRSVRIIGATYLSMLVGLVWTAALAMVTVGQYNTISIIFLVMFIGLGVDFAVHLCLKYQEARAHQDKQGALIETGMELGPAIALCGVTSAIGFLSFVPTEYIGLAEMGIISGGGMLIAVLVSLTLIPAFFMVVKDPGPATRLPFAETMTGMVVDKPQVTAYGTLLLALVLAAIASRASFDYSTLSIKNPDSEAMTTLRELQDRDVITDYALTWVAPDLEAAEAVREPLTELDLVSEVRTPTDYLPAAQDEKLFILEDAMFLLESVFSAKQDDTPFTDDDYVSQLTTLRAALVKRIGKGEEDSRIQGALVTLEDSISQLQAAGARERQAFSDLIVPPIKQEIAWLADAIRVDAISLNDLPADLRERLIAPDGRVVVSITPAIDVVPVDAMRAFTEDVIAVVPEVTGRPVLDLGIGDIVVEAFLTAIAIAVAAIFVVLLVTLRSMVDSILVFIPLAMTAMVTLAFSVLVDLPLNMANVVVIPLIFGLGVDNGIHIVKRFHQSTSVQALVSSSTPKAVFLSNLTTLGTFCALSFSTHQGIYSIGVLLTVALSALMVLTLISLPALLATFSTPRHP